MANNPITLRFKKRENKYVVDLCFYYSEIELKIRV